MTTFNLRYPLIISSIFLPLRAKSRERRIKDRFQFCLKNQIFRPWRQDHLHQFSPILQAHCKDKIPKFRNKYSQKRNIGVSVPISTFMRLWANYIFPPSVCLFCWRKYVKRSWDYINRSQRHECWNWGWGRAIPRKGLHKWDFRSSAVQLIQLARLEELPQQGVPDHNSASGSTNPALW
jgi:hypothetical protein